MPLYFNLTTKVNKLLDNKYILELYIILMAFVTMIGWRFNSCVGISILLGVGIVMIILTGSLNYIIPNLIYFIFNINKGFTSTEFPIYLIVLVLILVFVLIIFSIFNGFKLKKLKSIIGLLGMAIFMLIPIIWFKANSLNQIMFKYLYLSGFGYLLLYVLIVNGLNGNTISILASTMAFLPVIICYECSVTVYDLKNTTDDILRLWYYLGWGLCNEAGIMICFSLPFIFYLIGNEDNIHGNVYHNLKVVISIIGIILTTSRGSYLFGSIIIILSYLSLFFVARDKRKYLISFITGVIILFILALIFRSNILDFCRRVKSIVFNRGFDSSGRFNLWREAFTIFKSNYRNMFFGQGFASVIRQTSTALGYQDGIIVFHSTFFEALVVGGIFGTLFLIIHFIEKYLAIFKINKLFAVTMLIGYFFVDIYGMIDNTYFMYYYMITLIMIMASIDSTIYYKSMK